MPFFSIIIPTLNSAKTISVALESILQQTYNDYEILLMDGLSTDNTLEIARSYCDERFKISSEKDLGIYDAMNKGVKLSKGEWIFFLGSDDRLLNSNILQQINDEMSNNRHDVIYGNVLSPLFNGRYDGEFTYLKIMSQNICHQSIFIKKKVFKKNGLFNIRYKSHADWDHNLRWFLNPKVKKKYVNIDIAEYGAGGFSSVFFDELFASEKNIRIIRYGLFSLPFNILSSLSGEEYSKALSSKKIAKAIILKTINFYARLCKKIKLQRQL